MYRRYFYAEVCKGYPHAEVIYSSSEVIPIERLFLSRNDLNKDFSYAEVIATQSSFLHGS